MARRRCPVCRHERAEAIAGHLASGAMTPVAVAARYRVPVADVRAHLDQCARARALDPDPGADPVATPASLALHLSDTLADMGEIRRSGASMHASIRAAHAEVATAELLSRLVGADRPAAEAADMGQMIGSPAWRQLVESIDAALAEFPEARAALAAEIQARAAGGAAPPENPPPQARPLPPSVRARQV